MAHLVTAHDDSVSLTLFKLRWYARLDEVFCVFYYIIMKMLVELSWCSQFRKLLDKQFFVIYIYL